MAYHKLILKVTYSLSIYLVCDWKNYAHRNKLKHTTPKV